ncbi:CAV3 [Mytilus edulis]|uniref:CAV3 n=1 Tax=Mytilus edulis TaxID=6550 RepID=A0A8S3VEB4_MYTED|nr:CAV3 [Mytilus edulis]
MSDRGSKAGSFHEDASNGETEIPLNIPEDEPKVQPDEQPPPEIIYQNTPPSREPKNVRINLYDRDPTNMNELVKVQFDDIFAEPVGTHSFDGVWTASHTVFTGTKHWCYRILSAVCALPCSFCWGLHFACLSFNYIWSIQPSLRSFSIQIGPIAKVWKAESPTLPSSSCWDPRVDRIYQNESPSKAPASVRISLYDRDPSNINEIVRVQFEDLFTEPEGSHSIDGVWRTSYRVFTGTKHWCYRILSAIFAVPCAFCWGVTFCLSDIFSHLDYTAIIKVL